LCRKILMLMLKMSEFAITEDKKWCFDKTC